MNVLNINPKPGQGVYVFEFPVRAWHWTIVACIFTLFATGFIIAHPPQSLTGDPTRLFYFGYILLTHYMAGLILVIAMVCRIIWAFFGNSVSRQVFILPVWDKKWWKGLGDDIKWYLFLKKSSGICMGHNPLAQAAMFFAVLAMLYMCFTGLGIFQAKGYSSFFHMFAFMENMAYDWGGNGIDLVLWHRMGMVFLVAFAMIHCYMVVREDIMGRTTIISTMVNGYRLVKATLIEDWRDVQEEARDKKNNNG